MSGEHVNVVGVVSLVGRDDGKAERGAEAGGEDQQPDQGAHQGGKETLTLLHEAQQLAPKDGDEGAAGVGGVHAVSPLLAPCVTGVRLVKASSRSMAPLRAITSSTLPAATKRPLSSTMRSSSSPGERRVGTEGVR